jgi:hypothetical protein
MAPGGKDPPKGAKRRVYARFDRITARQCIARCTVFIRGFGDVRLGRRQQDTLNSNTHETRG